MQNKIIRVAALVAVAGAGLAWGGFDRARLKSGNRNLPAYTTGNQAAGTLPQSGCAKDYPYAQPNLGDLNSGCVGRKTNEGQCTCLGLTFGQNGCDPAWTWCSKTPIPQN